MPAVLGPEGKVYLKIEEINNAMCYLDEFSLSGGLFQLETTAGWVRLVLF